MSLSVNPNKPDTKVKYIVVKPKESIAPKLFTTVGIGAGAAASANIVKTLKSSGVFYYVGKNSRIAIISSIVGVVTAGIGMIGLALGNMVSFCTKSQRRKQAEEEYDLIKNLVKKQ